MGGGASFDSYFLHSILACGNCQLIILLKLEIFWWIIAQFWFTAKVLASKFGFDDRFCFWMINSINDQKILNHFFFLFIFCLVWRGWPRPGGWGPIWTMEAGARLEVVSWDEGEEKPAKETGPRSETFSLNSSNSLSLLPVGDGRPNGFCGNTGYPYLLYLKRNK